MHDGAAGPFLALDTDADADAVQMAAYRRIGGSGRVGIAFRLTAQVRETALAGIRRRHPDYDERRVALAWRRLTLGDDLTRAMCPGDELVEP